MKVFISWSGDVSHSIALKLYDWLPMVLQSVQPYMSSESIDKGTRWASSIASELEGTAVGIVVLTADNLTAPWIYFESGALAKVVGDSRLAPLLCGLKPSDIGTPLSQFQVTVFNSDDVLKLLKSINSCSGSDALPDNRLEKMHKALWQELYQDIEPLMRTPVGKSAAVSKVSSDETLKILEELLVLSRQQSQTLLNPEKLFPRDAIRLVAESVVELQSTNPSRIREKEYGIMRMLAHRIFDQWKDIKIKVQKYPSEGDIVTLKNILLNSNIEELCIEVIGFTDVYLGRNISPRRPLNLSLTKEGLIDDKK